MGKLRNIILILSFLILFASKVFADTVWINDLRSIFLGNNSIIYAINIRTFNANDKDKDGIIEEQSGEEKGTFINAINRLDELVEYGINTIDLLPITPVGKTKALGTAGSLYATSSFSELNPQLKSPNNSLTIEDEMKKFIEACHQRNIRVIVDLPCCGAYDLYLKRPELFAKDKNNNPIIPADWTDVRLLNGGTEFNINMDVYNMYMDFIDLMISMDVDGVRVNVPSTKPAAFWKRMIDETRARNPQFLFITDASPYKTPKISDQISLTSFSKLMDAGFDGYYGNYSDLQNCHTAYELISHIKSDINLQKKYASTKTVIGNFSTHDDISPILIKGPQYSKMIIWLNATLPLNAYSIDGFPTGDDYIYFWANKKAPSTCTDDEYYFVHRGQLDIFNFSRKPYGKRKELISEFEMANKFKVVASDIITKGSFEPHRTSSSTVFAYSRRLDKDIVFVMGNLDFAASQKVIVNAPGIPKDALSIPIKISNNLPSFEKNSIKTTLAPGEIQVMYVTVPTDEKE